MNAWEIAAVILTLGLVIGIGIVMVNNSLAQEEELCIPKYSGTFIGLEDNVGIVVFDLDNQTQATEFNKYLRQK